MTNSIPGHEGSGGGGGGGVGGGIYMGSGMAQTIASPVPALSSGNSCSTSAEQNATTNPGPLGPAPDTASSTSETQLSCHWEGCNRPFANAEILYEHICDKHIGRKSTNNLNLACRWNDCQIVTVKRDHITSHVRVHVPLKPHKCTSCGKSFKRPQDLKKHIKTHADEPVLVISAHEAMHMGMPTHHRITIPSHGYYAQIPQMRPLPTLGNLQQPSSLYTQPPNFHYYQPSPTHTQPPMYNSHPASHMSNPSMLGSRKRGPEQLDDLLESIKRREIDPTSYEQVTHSLMPIQRAFADATNSDYLTTAVAHNTLPPMSAASLSHAGPAHAQPSSALAQHYFLPPTASRTKSDLLEFDRILAQMQTTMYEHNPSSSTLSSSSSRPPHTHYDGHVRQSQSPAHLQAHSVATTLQPVSYPHLSTTHLASPISSLSPDSYQSTSSPAVTPPASSVSYVPGHSPTTSTSSTGFSPMSRHSSTASFMCPPLHGHNGSNIAPTIGNGFEFNRSRRHSGGILQRAAPHLSGVPAPVTINVRAPDDESPLTSPVSSTSSSDSEADARQEVWVENLRLVEWLRLSIQQQLKAHVYVEEPQQHDAACSGSPDVVRIKDEDDSQDDSSDLAHGVYSKCRARMPESNVTVVPTPRNSLYSGLDATKSEPEATEELYPNLRPLAL